MWEGAAGRRSSCDEGLFYIGLCYAFVVLYTVLCALGLIKVSR
jgi:hypothetical protein